MTPALSTADHGGDRRPAPPPWFLPLALCVAALFVAAAVAVAVVRPEPPTVTTRAQLDPTPSTSAAVAPEDGAPTAETATSAPDPAPTGTEAARPRSAPPATSQPAGGAPASGGGTELGAAQDPGPLSPPRPGTYQYGVRTGDGQQSEHDVKIEEAPAVKGNTSRRVSGARGGLDSTSTLVFEPGRVIVTETTFRYNGNEGRCDWDPDLLQSKLPLAQGSSWSSKSSCTVTGFGATPITVVAELSSKVVGLERRKVAGQVLDLWIVETASHYEFSGAVIDATSKDWVSPRHGLIVRTEASGSGRGPQGGSGQGSYTSEIKNLDPR